MPPAIDPATKPVTPYWISVSCAYGKIYSVPGGGGPGGDERTGNRRNDEHAGRRRQCQRVAAGDAKEQ